jgi:hypothetical protein
MNRRGEAPAQVLESDRRASRPALGDVMDAARVEGFASRQLNARGRMTALVGFYERYPCRMARVHLLATASVTLGAFCGYSQVFEDIGVAVLPVDSSGAARGAAWSRYVEACVAGRPKALRDELWLAAHGADIAAIDEAGLRELFEAEDAAHPGERSYTLLRQHLDVTLSPGRLGRRAQRGEVAYESAIAAAMVRAVWTLLTRSFSLLRRDAACVARALCS